MTIVHRHYNFNYIQLGERTMSETDEERQERTGLSSLKQADQASAEVQQTDNRVSLKQLEEKVTSVEYWHPPSIPHMTVAIVKLGNGYALLGKSVPADEGNYNEELGQKFAYEDAIRQMWALEAYLLRERMSL
jgi:hypothetical protein